MFEIIHAPKDRYGVPIDIGDTVEVYGDTFQERAERKDELTAENEELKKLKRQVQDLEYDLTHMELSICPNCGARLRVLDLEDENAKLRGENAKLRKLCADMMWTIRHAHGYFKDDTHELLMTYMRGRDGKPTHVAYSLTLDEEMYGQRMRELGMEV